MKAISIWQPWATLIALGEKRIETRGWETRYRGPLAIHAAKRWDRELADLCLLNEPIREALCRDPEISRRVYAQEEDRIGLSRFLPLGCVVATCRLVACLPTPRDTPDLGAPFVLGDTRRLPTADPMSYSVTTTERAFGSYEPGRWAWVLEAVRELRTPIPYRGFPGIFEMPDAIFTENAS